MRVLLAEDDWELRSLLTEALLGADCEVVEADSGDAAALLVDCPDGFDVLVTDIHMPGRLDGLELGRRFRARHARSPILYMTGQPDAMRGVRLHPHREAVLFKPCGMLALVATMQAMVAKSRQDSRTNSGSESVGSGWADAEAGPTREGALADQGSLQNARTFVSS